MSRYVIRQSPDIRPDAARGWSAHRGPPEYSYGYCFAGVGAGRDAYDTDDVLGFRTAAEAKQAGQQAYIDWLNQPLS
jgi:hypothetical protein